MLSKNTVPIQGKSQDDYLKERVGIIVKKLFFLMLFLLIFSAVGCSGNREETQPGSLDPAKESESAEDAGVVKDGLVADNFYYIAGPADLVDHFQEIEYSYTSISDKTEIQENGYYYLGPDTADGVQAEVFRLDLSNRYSGVWEFWLDSDRVPVKATENGEEVVDDLKRVDANLAYNSFTAPFVIVTTHYQLPLVSDPHLEYLGWRLVSEKTEKRNLGADAVDVSIYEFETDEGGAFYFEIAEINGKNMYINFQLSQPGKPSHDFQITRLIPKL